MKFELINISYFSFSSLLRNAYLLISQDCSVTSRVSCGVFWTVKLDQNSLCMFQFDQATFRGDTENIWTQCGLGVYFTE